MSENEETTTDERRINNRAPLDNEVTVRFEPQQVVGPGQNISEDGVFFVADAAINVQVEISGTGGEWRAGEIVRIQSMGEGKVGIAVRFV
ncbi:MAG: PilZ domain-containing protein [Planctomycetota bacterium]